MIQMMSFICKRIELSISRCKRSGYISIDVGDGMFLGMQDFDFAQISLQFCPNLINFAQKFFDRGCGCIPSSYCTVYRYQAEL